MNDSDIRDQAESNFFSFDKRILFLALRKKIGFIVLITFIISLLVAVWAKFTIKGEWKATCIIIRNSKNLSNKTDIPYLYQQFDLNTALESIATRKNLEEVIDSLSLDLNYRQLFRHISVKRGNKSNIIHLSATHLKRDIAVNIANTLANVVLKNYVEILNSSTKKIYQYYLSQREAYEVQLKEVQQKIQTFQENHAVISPETESQLKFEQLAELQLNYMQTKMTITALQTKISDIELRLQDLPERVPISYAITSTKEGKLREFQDELTILRKKYTENNPKIIKLKNKIAELKKEIATSSDQTILPDIVNYGEGPVRENLLVNKSQYENELASAKEQIKKVENNIENIKQELQSLTSLENQFYKIKSQENLIKNLLETIENRIVESKISMGSNISDFDILQPASPPENPEGTGKKALVLGIGILCFISLSVFYLGKEFLDFSVKSDFDFSTFLNLKLIGEIPSKDQIEAVIFYSQLQILFGQLNSILPQKKQLILTFGSDKIGCGKTFLAREILDLYLHQKKSILFIENCLNPDHEIEQYVINQSLYLENSEPSVLNITENLSKAYFHQTEDTLRSLLTKDKLDNFLRSLQQFDIIVWELFEFNFNMQLFSTIASSSDLLIFVTRFKISSREQLSNAVKFLRENTSINMAGILNDIRKPFFKTKF